MYGKHWDEEKCTEILEKHETRSGYCFFNSRVAPGPDPANKEPDPQPVTYILLTKDNKLTICLQLATYCAEAESPSRLIFLREELKLKIRYKLPTYRYRELLFSAYVH